MKANRQMETLWPEIQEQNLDDAKALPQKLLTLLNAGFVEDEQCVFLSPLKAAVPVKCVDFPNRTQFECYVNHIRIEDYLENGGLPPLEMLGCGFALAHELKERLSRLRGAKHFRIIVTFDGSTCRVRFHTVRADEEWLDKDLNALEEAIAYFETRELEL